MVKEEIIDGLRYAVARGESLEKAMMSFFNAGYSKEEIEEAARLMNSPQISGTGGQVASEVSQNQQSQPAQQPSQPQQSQANQTQTPPTQGSAVQRVSQYGKPPRSSASLLTMILSFVLLLLIGILVAVFLFREELSEFLSNLVG